MSSSDLNYIYFDDVFSDNSSNDDVNITNDYNENCPSCIPYKNDYSEMLDCDRNDPVE